MNSAKFFTSERLRALRAEKKINGRKRSQAAAAAVFGVSDRTYKAWETGRSLPDTESLLRIAAEYGVSCDYLLGLVETRTPGVSEFASLTGLSSQAVDALCRMGQNARDYAHFEGIPGALSAFLEYAPSNLFSLCEQFAVYCSALSKAEVQDAEDNFELYMAEEDTALPLFRSSRILQNMFERAGNALHKSRLNATRGAAAAPETETSPS